MKKQLSLFVMAAVLAVTPAVAETNFGTRAGSSADLTGAPGTRTRSNVNYEKYETRTLSRTYDAQDAKNMYYTQPAKRSDLYKQYTNSQTNVRTTRGETLRGQLQRKYFLAHPFFQPVKGKFGSITDLSYTWNDYDLASVAGVPFKVELGGVEYPVAADDFFQVTLDDGSYAMKGISVKEDFSYGITDTIAVLGMLRYDAYDYEFDWKNSPDDKWDDSDLTMYGLGAQWRFLDNAQWIATASAYFQHQKDSANSYILDLKAGYKVGSSTIYGLVRGWYLDLEGDAYGVGLVGKDDAGNETMFFASYNDDASSVTYVEGGLGVFSVLEQDWTLNVEGIFGNYDWHNQLSVKAALGWQPNDWFALNLYAKTALYDSADGEQLPYTISPWEIDVDGDGVVESLGLSGGAAGFGEIDQYSETTVGLQAIFMF